MFSSSTPASSALCGAGAMHHHVRSPALHLLMQIPQLVPDLGLGPAFSQVVPDDLSGHIVLIGKIAWNKITGQLSELSNLPVRQIEDPRVVSGEIFAVDTDGKERKFLPTWASDGALIEDVGCWRGSRARSTQGGASPYVTAYIAVASWGRRVRSPMCGLVIPMKVI